jgi:cell shape-determining protein MreC
MLIFKSNIPKAISFTGFVAMIFSIVNSIIFFAHISSHDPKTHFSTNMLNMILGFVGLVSLLLGEFLKKVDQRISQLEKKPLSSK